MTKKPSKSDVDKLLGELTTGKVYGRFRRHMQRSYGCNPNSPKAKACYADSIKRMNDKTIQKVASRGGMCPCVLGTIRDNLDPKGQFSQPLPKRRDRGRKKRRGRRSKGR